MSLFDTLIIQEYIQPPAQTSVAAIRREIFVAIRNDRPLGLPDLVFLGQVLRSMTGANAERWLFEEASTKVLAFFAADLGFLRSAGL